MKVHEGTAPGKAVLGGGFFPLHQPYRYSLHRWVPPILGIWFFDETGETIEHMWICPSLEKENEIVFVACFGHFLGGVKKPT